MSISHSAYRFLWNRRWIPRAFKRHFYKRLARRGVPVDIEFIQDFFGIRYRGNLNNNIDFNIYFYGAFEKPLLFFLRDTMRAITSPRPVFIDVGANVGQHSLFMAAHGAQVHAFEPFGLVRDQLQRQIEESQLDNITLHPLGLGNDNTRLPFYAPTGSNAGIGSFDAGSTSKGNVRAGDLALARGDDYFPLHGIDRIDLVKIDVEGFEKFALQGLRECLRRTRPVIVCEVTLGGPLSFSSLEELRGHLPDNYQLFTFDKRKADGSKARRRNAGSRHTGQYRIVPCSQLPDTGQDDVIAWPREKAALMPLSND